jgi:hypothetical protein
VSGSPASSRLALMGSMFVVASTGCAAGASARANAEQPAGVHGYGRPSGMPIGASGPRDALEALEPAPPEVSAEDDVPEPASPVPSAARVPCAGCVELNVKVDDINQRDEFAFAVDGARVTKVTWTIRVNFNSDQLAVQPFIDGERGKYTELHVNTFPLGAAVSVEQEHTGRAHAIGLVVGSSGAWTGDQTMSVFVDSVRVEGMPAFEKTFASDAEGLAARTHQHEARLVVHPETPVAAAPP